MASSDTRLRLIVAAEQLFGERGLESVSLREVNVAAGQRNTSASHYHFGCKAALTEAIFEHRRPALIAGRNRAMDALEAQGKGRDLRALVGAMVESLAAQIGPESESRHYLPFLAELWRAPPEGPDALFARLSEGNERLAGPLREQLGHVPAPQLTRRLQVMSRHVVVTLSDFQRLQDQGTASMSLEAFVTDLADCVVAYLAAPVTSPSGAES